MGRTKLPSHIRRLLPPEHREPRTLSAQPADSARADLLRRAGADSELELILLNRLERAGLPVGESHQQIIPGRGYAYDRVWRAQRVCVEVQGGIYARMRHSTGTGIERDCEKFSLAAAHGWRLLPVSRKQIESGQAVELIAQALGLEAPRANH